MPNIPLLTQASSWIVESLDPSLLSKNYRSRWTPENPTFGFCSVASEALYFILGGAPAGWHAMVGKDDTGTHWWLEHDQGHRCDVTSDQFHRQNRLPPYDTGRPAGFMGMRIDRNSVWGFERCPSRRARLLLSRVLVQQNINENDTVALKAWLCGIRQPVKLSCKQRF